MREGKKRIMRMENPRVKVAVTHYEADKIDKWAETFNGEKICEALMLPSRRIEKVYQFHSLDDKNRFISDLRAKLGKDFEVI